jgi:RHS repeat-associated protein
VDASGNIAASYAFSAWGEVLSTTINSSLLTISSLRYLWQGREYSHATGLYNFRARWYDPVTGRWLSKDPIGLEGGLNLYVFCDDDPINWRDPWGLLVSSTYNRTTSLFSMKDDDTGEAVEFPAESGGKPWGDPIPTGDYTILDHPDDDFKRLEPVDSNYGDDICEKTKRNKFRLHRPGRTIGCIALKDPVDWKKIKDILKKTKTEDDEVKSKSRNPFKKGQPETIKKFGKMKVVD